MKQNLGDSAISQPLDTKANAIEPQLASNSQAKLSLEKYVIYQ